MSRIVNYVANFICFFLIIVHANASKLEFNYDNQILSSIYSEYNNDYETWKNLPSYDEYKDKEINYLNKFIINQNNTKNQKHNLDSYIADLFNSLTQIRSGECTNLNLNNFNYIFEESLSLTIKFWNSYCQNNVNFEYLEKIDNRFENLKVLNKLYFYHLRGDIFKIRDVYKNIKENRELLSQLNFKQLNLVSYIFSKSDLDFSLDNFIGIKESLSKLTFDLDSEYQIDDYLDFISMQVLQTSTYYFYAKDYKKSLALLSYLQQSDSKNKEYYDYQKISFIAQLTPNSNTLELIQNFEFQNKNFEYFKDYLYLKTATDFNYNLNEMVDYFKAINWSTEWQRTELALIVAMEYYSKNDNLTALEFLDDCCLNNLSKSQDPIQLFKYGILLERNDYIDKSEDIIQKSIDISNGSYPSILNYLAYLWVENDQNLEKAEEMLIKAVEESNYQDGAILDSLGWLYFKKKKIELAKKWITQAYIMEPSEPEIIDHLSQIYLQLNRTKESRYLDNKIILFHKDYFKYNEVLNRN